MGMIYELTRNTFLYSGEVTNIIRFLITSTTNIQKLFQNHFPLTN